MALDQVVAAAHAPVSKARYDRWTICLHWLTALLVVGLFAAAYVWNSLPPGTPLRKWLQAIHISFGLLFTVVFVIRLFWRSSRGRRLAMGILSKGMHILLYALLTAQVLLGFLLRWAQGEPFLFFGLFFGSKPLRPRQGAVAHLRMAAQLYGLDHHHPRRWPRHSGR